MATGNTPRKFPYFRVYSDILSDPKTVELSNAELGFFIRLLAIANQQDPRGEICSEVTKLRHFVTFLTQTKTITVQKYLTKLSDLDLIRIHEEQNRIVITNWHKRQFISDDATARSLKRYYKDQEIARATERATARARVEVEYKDIKAQNPTNDLAKTSPSLDQVPDEKKESDKELWKKINAVTNGLKDFFPEGKQFSEKANKMGYHPGAILQALERCHKYLPNDPFAYCWRIVQVESGNYHYEDFQKEEMRMKEEFGEIGVTHEHSKRNVD